METLPQEAVVCGVDTHPDVHAAAVVDLNGRVLGVSEFAATTWGFRRLTDWVAGFGPVAGAGVEGTSSYGKGLTFHPRRMDVDVREVIRPNRQIRRFEGKSDPADAIAAARALDHRHGPHEQRSTNTPIRQTQNKSKD